MANQVPTAAYSHGLARLDNAQARSELILDSTALTRAAKVMTAAGLPGVAEVLTDRATELNRELGDWQAMRTRSASA